MLTLDEFEALRLSDLDGLYQEQAAAKMNVSRATFSRIVDEARRKTADALVHGKALRIEGGPVRSVGRSCCQAHDRKGPGPRPRRGRGPGHRNGRGHEGEEP